LVNYKNRLSTGVIVALAISLIVSTGWSRQEGGAQEKKANVELPAAVAKAVKANFPDAEIGTAELEKEAGINLYDIEFKADKGEIEVAEDGTVMDIATIVSMNEVPKAAAEAILESGRGATIKQIEKSEIRAEIKREGEKGRLVKLDNPRYVYEAEFKKGNQSGEIQVAPDGKIVEALKWRTRGAKK
jgi:uncharacterized membrane protein YkoI